MVRVGVGVRFRVSVRIRIRLKLGLGLGILINLRSDFYCHANTKNLLKCMAVFTAARASC